MDNKSLLVIFAVLAAVECLNLDSPDITSGRQRGPKKPRSSDVSEDRNIDESSDDTADEAVSGPRRSRPTRTRPLARDETSAGIAVGEPNSGNENRGADRGGQMLEGVSLTPVRRPSLPLQTRSKKKDVVAIIGEIGEIAGGAAEAAGILAGGGIGIAEGDERDGLREILGGGVDVASLAGADDRTVNIMDMPGGAMDIAAGDLAGLGDLLDGGAAIAGIAGVPGDMGSGSEMLQNPAVGAAVGAGLGAVLTEPAVGEALTDPAVGDFVGTVLGQEAVQEALLETAGAALQNEEVQGALIDVLLGAATGGEESTGGGASDIAAGVIASLPIASFPWGALGRK